jgi:hypothetical protein
VSKWKVCLVIGVYFLVAFSFEIYLELRKPLEYLHAVSIARAFGGAVGLFLFSSIIPVIIWAISKFRIERAKTMLIIWAICGLLYGIFQKIGSNQCSGLNPVYSLSTAAFDAMHGCL